MKVEEHTAYIKSRRLSKMIWDLSRNWNLQALSTLGNQLIRSADSISANLAEGWNRYSKKDKTNFYIIARGSIGETMDWINKAFERNLINQLQYSQLQDLLEELPKEINGLIKGTNQHLRK